MNTERSAGDVPLALTARLAPRARRPARRRPAGDRAGPAATVELAGYRGSVAHRQPWSSHTGLTTVAWAASASWANTPTSWR
jgi:hypothetical protein